MSTFSLTIDTDNAAFPTNPGEEIARILHLLADDLVYGYGPAVRPVLRDINGNAVGMWSIS